MIIEMLLLDVAPDPVRGPIIGIAGLIVIVVIVLMLAAAAITGLVFLLWVMRKSRQGVSLNVSDGSPQPAAQLQPSNPNQP
jgi:hypothetical protein